MTVAGDGDDLLSYTTKWFDQVQRGGLYPLNDQTFSLFIAIEKCVRIVLPNRAVVSNSDKATFKRNVHDKITKN